MLRRTCFPPDGIAETAGNLRCGGVLVELGVRSHRRLCEGKAEGLTLLLGSKLRDRSGLSTLNQRNSWGLKGIAKVVFGGEL
jgi:hypothetical protein